MDGMSKVNFILSSTVTRTNSRNKHEKSDTATNTLDVFALEVNLRQKHQADYSSSHIPAEDVDSD